MSEYESALVIGARDLNSERVTGLLRSCGLYPVCCSTLWEGRALLAQRTFSMVITGDVLPDGDFRAAIRAVRESSANTPVIVLSRSGEWDAFLGAIGAGAFDYIACPFDTAETKKILWSARGESFRLHRTAQAAA
jgi:DNA-binding NtrC family response regulator